MNDEKWKKHAACLGANQDLFFPEQGEVWKVRRAKQICAKCTVRPQCLEGALERDEEFGIWGGTTRDERSEIIKTRKRDNKK